MLSDERLAALAARAATLEDRLAGVVDLVPPPPGVADARLDRWARVVARGDGAVLDVRLGLDGLDRAAARRILGEARPRPGAPLPEWAVLVGEALAEAPRALARPDDRVRGSVPAVPLEDLVLPFVRAARARLDALAPAAGIAEAVAVEQERALLRHVSTAIAPVVAMELDVLRDRALGPLGVALARSRPDRGRARYDGLVARLLGGGLDAMLEDHPALARITGLMMAGWIGATADFRAHLAADREAIGHALGGGVPPGDLVRIGGAVSDPHRGRRMVVACRFASGLRVVYKPKGLASEAVLGRLLGWLSARGLETPMRPLAVLDRGDHGWVEFAAQEPVPDRAAAARYFRRAGALLALLHAVGGNDCHMENLVASGEHPQVIDAETVLHPRLMLITPTPGGAPRALDAAGRRAGESVLGVGLLPMWMVSEDGSRSLDISGLGARGAQRGLAPMPRWEDPDTDMARLVLELGDVPPARNEVVLDGAAVPCEDHAGDVEAGFREAYGLLAGGREELLAPGGPVDALAGATLRVLYRPTRVYAQVLNSTYRPADLREGVDRSIALEILARPLLDADEAAPFWPLHRMEQHDLEATDIPYLAVRGDAEGLAGGDGRPALRFDASAVANARNRLAALGPDDLALQVAFVRAAMAARGTPEPAAPAPRRRPGADPLRGALVVGRMLRDAAVRGPEGGAAWVGAALGDEASRWELQPTGLDLYNGLPGIALFLAALARASGEPEWAALAADAVAPAAALAEAGPARTAAYGGIGAAEGAGGLAFALVALAGLLDDPALLRAAVALTGGVDRAAVAEDDTFDLMGGGAGLVLGMLAVHGATGDPTALALARAAGDRLLAAQAPAPEGGAAWAGIAPVPLAGASHGASGCALALARLAAQTGEGRYADGARAALAFERGCHVPGRGWPDRRPDQVGAGDPGSWCHGAAGIALTRAALLRTGPADADWEAELVAALGQAAGRLPARDHLCCGAAGAAEAARAAAGLGFGGPLSVAAAEWARDVAERLGEGAPPLLGGPRLAGLPAPGLFQGASGVGLALVGAHDPAAVSVLTWAA